MGLQIVHQDITEMECDVIVNAANTHLLAGGGVCGAIFNKAGYQQMTAACQLLAPVATGQAVITPGFQLKAQAVIHAVGPVYRVGGHHEKQLLADAYRHALLLASKHHFTSIAFPVISSGIYGYPYDEALQVAKDTILAYLKNHDLEVFLVIYQR